MRETLHLLSGLLLVAAVALASGAPVQTGEVPLGTEQVERGQTVYREHCVTCHGRDLAGTPQFPALVGEAFETDWAGRTLGEFYTYVHDNMPLGAGGSLSDEQYADVVAYVLAQNRLPTGEWPFEPAEGAEVMDLELTFPEEDAAEE
jgi:mono/diheme cytochrome c family protein